MLPGTSTPWLNLPPEICRHRGGPPTRIWTFIVMVMMPWIILYRSMCLLPCALHVQSAYTQGLHTQFVCMHKGLLSAWQLLPRFVRHTSGRLRHCRESRSGSSRHCPTVLSPLRIRRECVRDRDYAIYNVRTCAVFQSLYYMCDTDQMPRSPKSWAIACRDRYTVMVTVFVRENLHKA